MQRAELTGKKGQQTMVDKESRREQVSIGTLPACFPHLRWLAFAKQPDNSERAPILGAAESLLQTLPKVIEELLSGERYRFR